MDNVLTLPRHGDHIFVVRRATDLRLPYLHHGILDRSTRKATVIHLGGRPGRSKRGARVRRDSLRDFARGSRVYVWPHNPANVLPPEEVVTRAASRIGHGGYDMLWNNCEHFAWWAKAGKPRSLQVVVGDRLLALVVTVGQKLFNPS
ncbi:hypothetical protein D6833_04790 [Candidatus Parcubacteria bacterium]|nr:MAG: hypothetical protein D6833_04790 [Candidatus Parcubacteria bacterium]